VVVSPSGWVSRQLCEPLCCFRLRLPCHLLPAAAAAGFIYCSLLGGAITPTYSSKLCLFRVLSGTCPSPFLQCVVLPACYSCSTYLFRVHIVNFPSPTLWQSIPHVSQHCKPSSPKAHWGVPPNPPSQAGFFIYISWGCLPLLLWSSKSPALFATCLFQFSIYYSVFFNFVGQRSVCPGDYAGLSQGWLWGYHVPLICSPVSLRLPSRLRVGALLVSPYNVAWRSYVWAGDSGCWIFASSWWFFLPGVSPASQQDFYFMELTLSASSL
jgi:hypothetical protein